jgi:hypothetical protein
LPASPKTNRSGWNQAARELEERLLIHAEEFHSETGAHVKRLESWTHWAKRVGLVRNTINREEAKQILEKQAQEIVQKSTAEAKLPWMKK